MSSMRRFYPEPNPHIFLRRGYWRVSPWNHVICTLGKWRDAHDFVNRMNQEKKQ